MGIFTTAWAWLELYNVLDLVRENVLYIDTNSCFSFQARLSAATVRGLFRRVDKWSYRGLFVLVLWIMLIELMGNKRVYVKLHK